MHAPLSRNAWCWGPELNPFRSLQQRRGNATCDNCYWQCVWHAQARAPRQVAVAGGGDDDDDETTTTTTTTTATVAVAVAVARRQRQVTEQPPGVTHSNSNSNGNSSSGIGGRPNFPFTLRFRVSSVVQRSCRSSASMCVCARSREKWTDCWLGDCVTDWLCATGSLTHPLTHSLTHLLTHSH